MFESVPVMHVTGSVRISVSPSGSIGVLNTGNSNGTTISWDPKNNLAFFPPYPQLNVKLLTDSAILPTKAHHDDLGFDLYCAKKIIIPPGCQELISTGISVEFPFGYGGIIKDRSSIAKEKLYTHAGVIDPQYRGEIKVMMENRSLVAKRFSVGNKIAQMVLIYSYDINAVEVDSVDETKRGEKGFGSSGS
jgi:dUTP pyrophosphatase